MKKILMPAMLALLLFTAGCDKPSDNNPPENPPATPAQKPEVKPEVKPDKPNTDSTTKPDKSKEASPVKNERTEQSINVKVYYPDDSGMKLVEVEREVIVDDATNKYTAAVETLLDEPEEENLTKIFPPFPFSVDDFCVLFKKILPTSLLPRFCPMFSSK